MTRALVTLDELKTRLQAARDMQVYVEDRRPACEHSPLEPKADCPVCEARAFTDAAFQAVLDALPRQG